MVLTQRIIKILLYNKRTIIIKITDITENLTLHSAVSCQKNWNTGKKKDY